MMLRRLCKVPTPLTLYGEMRKVLERQSAPDNRELRVDYYKMIGRSPSDADAITNRVSAQQDQWDAQMLDKLPSCSDR
jgi:asparaginyl-tRNA synthetase